MRVDEGEGEGLCGEGKGFVCVREQLRVVWGM